MTLDEINSLILTYIKDHPNCPADAVVSMMQAHTRRFSLKTAQNRLRWLSEEGYIESDRARPGERKHYRLASERQSVSKLSLHPIQQWGLTSEIGNITPPISHLSVT